MEKHYKERMMDEYVSKETVLELLCEKCPEQCIVLCCPTYLRIHQHPAADVKPVVKGKWITEEHFERTIDGSTIAIRATYCSKCGCVLVGKFDNFCPNCGADMRNNVV